MLITYLATALAACGLSELSTEDASQVARAHIAGEAQVDSASLELTNVSTSEHEGNTVICGVVSGPTLPPGRFIAKIAPGDSVIFERAAEIGRNETNDFDSRWHRICKRSAG